MKRKWDDFRYARVPYALLAAKDRVTLLDSCVFGVVNAAVVMQKSNPARTSIHKISDAVGSTRQKVRASVAKLIDLGVLTVKGSSYRIDVPDWVSDATRKKNSVQVAEDNDEDDFNEDDFDEEDLADIAAKGGSTATGEGGTQRVPGGNPEGPRGGNPEGPPLVDLRERSKKRSDPEARPSRATSEDRISLPSKERSREITDWGEEEEENPDGESKTAAAAIERRKAARAARRETKTQTKKLRVKTADDFVGSFSERPQVVAAASRPVTSGRALVMYWARRFREVTGSEDAELRFPNLEAEPFRILSRNVTLHVNNFLGGDWEDAKKAVDEILERAERLGYPRKMSYFFTPSKDGAMLAIRANRRKDGKKTAPYQNDDIYGSNRKLFQENPKFQEYKARMKKMVEGHTT